MGALSKALPFHISRYGATPEVQAPVQIVLGSKLFNPARARQGNLFYLFIFYHKYILCKEKFDKKINLCYFMVMSQHPSLKIKGAGTEHRSVLKRFERILKLQTEEKWKEGDSIFGLAKVKTTRLKIKKEKAAPTPEEAAAAEAQGAEGAASGEAAKGAEKGNKPAQESGKKPDKKK